MPKRRIGVPLTPKQKAQRSVAAKASAAKRRGTGSPKGGDAPGSHQVSVTDTGNPKPMSYKAFKASQAAFGNKDVGKKKDPKGKTIKGKKNVAAAIAKSNATIAAANKRIAKRKGY